MCTLSKGLFDTFHPAQVIAIFCMLGFGTSKSELTNNLVQIGTVEGKSVTLTVACCVLALLGFDVNFASYSEYLEARYFKFLSHYTFHSLSNVKRIFITKFFLWCFGKNKKRKRRQKQKEIVCFRRRQWALPELNFFFFAFPFFFYFIFNIDDVVFLATLL
ncbi:hypothetical protein RFI_31335 [Reticulomyxa filosa]|uniref:SecA family profile domain-containing protein n=1 Tax=Reticulomyxa filosa TaxID=46433 RepID=X6LXG8_RETFI|nr:hypothetical protein RFI_31335 [Reticulomyxa filosa]|eukprot:ETO06061.1 hypothetical protein RFI_31335 [Reticulomyxa filosa]